MKKLFILTISVATTVFVSCSSSKKTANSNNNTSPTQEVVGTPQDIEYGYGRSGDKGKAYRDALRNAQQNIATRLYRVMSAVDTDFGQDIAMGENLQSLSKRSERFVGIIDDKVVSIRNTKEPKFEKNNAGIWECEVVVVMDNSLADDVAQSIYQSLSNDDALRVKFEEHQFKAEFDKELKAYRERQQK